ncbi:ATP synthase F0 subcomplex subunit B [Leptolyngbya sp. BL0902]|uniref:F0F1 ATP synthase subunit B family protein n=1 Tax=Leptolyngbya sp. BL0902 TaxID=1115757 RepID=UPI0018E87C5B|nr:F0F1 ATP synthase subunit B [Leptolyngbya sp. BL0902]QQE63675.1 ATP synthase F0 subcomplex subunit B [Leptolyngbya sp. BL0902]
MLINGFTVFAQILNFLILVALLRWVLYKPILRVMGQRQQQIQERWQGAERLQTEAQQTLADYQRQQQDWEAQRQAQLAAMRSEVEQERQRQMAQLRQEADQQRASWQADLHQAQAALAHQLGQQVMQQTLTMARQAMTDLANADLERQMVAVFCDHLRRLPADQHHTLVQALAPDLPIAIRSSFSLSPDLQQHIINALGSTFGTTPAVEFSTTSDLICGLELRLAGQEVVWSFDTYLATLEQRLATALTGKIPSSQAPPEPPLPDSTLPETPFPQPS